MSSTLINRKRGAPYGNRNAFRHGFYSKTFTPAEEHSLDDHVRGEFADEIAMARVNAVHMAELLMSYKTMPFENVVSGSNALNHFLDSILALSRNYHFLYRKNNSTTYEEAMDFLTSLPPEED